LEAGEVSLDQFLFMHQVPLDEEGNIVRYFRTVEPVPEQSTLLMLISVATLGRSLRSVTSRKPRSALSKTD
jgi:hypothetical protein